MYTSTPAERIAIVEQWAREFAAYRERIEQVHRDVLPELLARLARVGVVPAVLREDIEARRARGWTIDHIGPVLDVLALETHRATSNPAGRVYATYARALFDAMADDDACPLSELAARVEMRAAPH